MNTTFEQAANIIVVIFIFFAILIGIFFALRKFTLWYFRIDERINQNEEIIKLLKKIASRLPEPEEDDFLK